MGYIPTVSRSLAGGYSEPPFIGSLGQRVLSAKAMLTRQTPPSWFGGAEMRVAETRAVNRAMRKAHGIGICSVEELGSHPFSLLEPKKQDDPAGNNGSFNLTRSIFSLSGSNLR